MKETVAAILSMGIITIKYSKYMIVKFTFSLFAKATIGYKGRNMAFRGKGNETSAEYLLS